MLFWVHLIVSAKMKKGIIHCLIFDLLKVESRLFFNYFKMVD